MDLKVLGNGVFAGLQIHFLPGEFELLHLSRSGKIAKFIEPMLKEANSGLYFETTATRCSGVWPRPPPVVVQRIRSHLLLTLASTCPKSSKSGWASRSRVAHVNMGHGSPRLISRDGVLGQLVGRNRQVRTHRRGMDSPGQSGGKMAFGIECSSFSLRFLSFLMVS